MTEPAIAPLAQRLAEENNVDWRNLQGSSVDGAINERDVLDYLEEVTLGTQPLDPTPEPLPEGLTAWPEEHTSRQLSHLSAEPVDVAGTPELPPTPPAIVTEPVKTFETEYRTALAELTELKPKLAQLEPLRVEVATLKTKAARLEPLEAELAALKIQANELASLKTRLAALGAEQKQWQRERQELLQGQGASALKDQELARAKAFEPQVAQLQAALASSQLELRRLEQHGDELTSRLAELEGAKQQAQSTAKRLESMNAELEQTVAGFKTRPWWKFWG